MESKIRVLSEQTINQIAAGEVIENAASVIKELVENSIDAGANQISIEISGGGRQLIRVRDNGCGMSEDDALLCLERHATSKISSVDDLYAITSMGFRGEAMPSIASISKMTITTAPKNEKGTLVIIEGGKILKAASVDCEAGTAIEVRDLFFNVPARRKFQKSPSHDIQEIVKCVTLLALGYPEIHFELVSNQKTVLKTSSTGCLKERLADVLGNEFVQEMTPLEAEQMSGFIGLPACTRHNRSGQFLFINQRAVTSSLVSYAVREGYGPSLPSNRHPLFVLHMTLPGSLVDINVHPQKREVRLRQEQTLRATIIQAVQASLPKQDSFLFLPHEEPVSYTLPPNAQMPSWHIAEKPIASYEPLPSFITSPLLPVPPPMKKTFKILTTLPGYIVAEKEESNSLVVIDQRAAHARVIYEQLLHAQKISSQQLLLPYTMTLTPSESLILEPLLPLLNSCGVSIKAFGAHTFVVDSLPHIFGEADLDRFVHALLLEADSFSLEDELKKQIAQTASRSSIAKNRRLSLFEAQKLLSQLADCAQSDKCPQNKPIMAFWTMEEMAKDLK